MTFKELDLIEPILKALEQTGYTTPTPIQEQAIPVLLKGKDLLGCAQTGTGKTAAFAIPIIQRLYQSDSKKGIIWQPGLGAVTVLYMLSVTFLIIGCFRIIFSFELKRLHKNK